jgi:dolichol kinase
MALLYPLHVCTAQTIEYLTTTSLDPTERQLLAVGMIDLYLFAESAQSEILKALLWLGATLIFLLCQMPLQWELALARIPSWRLRTSNSNRQRRSSLSLLQRVDRIISSNLAKFLPGGKFRQELDRDDDEDLDPVSKKIKPAPKLSITINGLLKHPTTNFLDHNSASAVEPSTARGLDSIDSSTFDHHLTTQKRRHTLSAIEPPPAQHPRTTPSGRPKRSVAIASQSFLAFTPAQAAVRKWAYAAFVYAAVLFIVLGPIRIYVGLFALKGFEPFGWALGYLLGNMPLFRLWVSSISLDTWIRFPDPSSRTFLAQMGWVERLRQITLGPANMRILLCVYCLLVLLAGMATVLKLSSIAEVDTRRKVFHGVMVIMLLPTIFVDPCFISLALILILAIFLLLDLFRASQLPPVSKPLTTFLAPYVDGRDHRGPVIVSHIFLLIGCAIPLWLSLAAVRRGGHDPWAGWDVEARDVSMISGVVCVGMGDSAASLVGRRYGRHKWYWGGGKSLEGSLAFAAAVTVGLVAAYTWLRVGGWVMYNAQAPAIVLGKAFLAALGASLTEAVLTGANDNVVVPVMLWLLVRGLGL